MKARKSRKETSKNNSSSLSQKNKIGFFRRNNSFFNVVQTKQMVQKPEDKQEQEADKMSEQMIQRQTMPEKDKDEKVQKMEAPKEEDKLQKREEEEETKKMHAKADGHVTASRHVETGINKTKGKGNPLPAAVNAQMGSTFGTDFSNVKIHNDSKAAELNKELNAHAFTHGNDIYFNAGKYDTNSQDGKKLLAHELTHVVQQKADNPEEQQVQRNEAAPHNQSAQSTTISYMVKTGEAIEQIAMRFGTTVHQIIALNRTKLKTWASAKGKGITMQGFDAGEKILIPQKQIEEAPPTTTKK